MKSILRLIYIKHLYKSIWIKQGILNRAIPLVSSLNVLNCRVLSILLCFTLTTQSELFSQAISLNENIRNYQFHFSTAMQYSYSSRNDLANKEILIANSFMPIHQWHGKELRFLLKREFNDEIYYILVKMEFTKDGYSNSSEDSLWCKLVSKDIKRKIEKNKSQWQLDYLNHRNISLEKKLLQIESIDQFSRTINMGAIIPCGDSCFSLKRKLFRYSDSAYSRKYFNEIIKVEKLNVADFGASYFDFLLIARHLLNGINNDSNLNILYRNFCINALHNFFITPDYYANLMDYCFNFKFDEFGNKMPTNSYGEFLNYKGKIYIDNPETIDQKRAELGLLPIYQTIRDSTKLPANYLDRKNRK
jgi:hypothetical protein